MPKQYVAAHFSGALPAVPVFKGGDVHYCHTQRELDEWTKSIQDGGKGWSEQYEDQEWPKVMSHPVKADIKVFSHAEIKTKEAEGYSFDHFNNSRSKQIASVKERLAAARATHNDALVGQLAIELDALEGGAGGGSFEAFAAPPSFNPAADAEVADLKRQLAELKAMLQPARRRPGRKPKAAEAVTA